MCEREEREKKERERKREITREGERKREITRGREREREPHLSPVPLLTVPPAFGLKSSTF